MYDTEVFRRLYPILNDFIIHFVIFKRISRNIDDLSGSKEFWVYTNDAHLKEAVILWCMVFGQDSNDTHWKNLNKEWNNEFRNYIKDKGNITKKEWNDYWKKVLKFRNEFIAHRTIADYNEPIPYLDMALKIVLLFDKWIRTKTDDIGFNTLDVYVEEYERNITSSFVLYRNKGSLN